MQSVKSHTTPTEPTFLTERRGGWDEWEPERTVLVGVALPSGEVLGADDEVTVSIDSAPVAVEGDVDEVTARIEVGSWVGDGRKVELESPTKPWFSVTLSESEFRDAWGEWLKS